uniref:Pyroglutamyl-peptidase I n=1 Tax=Strigamia maritima TaxID=126957 RepID=T1JJ94_STRMM
SIKNAWPSNDYYICFISEGFSPFANYKTNASWESVKELEKIGLGDDINLVVEKIEVVYDHVDSRIPELWKKYKPKLVVHCGVSSIAHYLTLEQRGHRQGYISQDESGKTPRQEMCLCSDKDCIESGLEMSKVCEAVNSSDCGVIAVVSQDAGRFLCDYTYFSSLSIDSSRTAFIHVPTIDKPYTAQQLAQAIRIATLCMLEQLECFILENCQDD